MPQAAVNGNDFLDAFYSRVQRSGVSAEWQDRLQRRGLPIVLPYRTPSGHLGVMLIAGDAADFRWLGDQFRAFLGKTYSGDAVVRQQPGANTQFIADYFGQNCYFARLIIRPGREAEAEKVLLDWHGVWEQWDGFRQSGLAEQTNAERLREAMRRFQQGLAAKDRGAALGALSVIEEKAFTETANRLFLRVQLHAAFREWDAILEGRALGDLLQIRKPAAVTEALIQAVYHVHLAPCAEDLDSLCDRFARRVYPDYRPLYRSRGTLRSSEVVRSFMLRAVAVPGDTDPVLRDELLELPELSDEDRELLRRLAVRLPTPPQDALEAAPSRVDAGEPRTAGAETVTTAAEAAFLSGHNDAALRLIQAAPPTRDKVQLLLRFTRQEETLLAQSLALSAIQSLPPAEQRTLLRVPQMPSALQRLLTPLPAPDRPTLDEGPEQVAAVSEEEAVEPRAKTEQNLPPALPAGWTQWLEHLRDRSLPGQVLLECAEAGIAEWSVVPLSASVGTARSFADAIDEAREDRGLGPGGTRVADIFLDALPALIRAFLEDSGYPRAVFAPVYESLRLTLTHDLAGRGISNTVLILFLDLMAGQMVHGVSADAYGGILDEIDHYWGLGGSANARALLDLLDALLEFPVPQSERREKTARAAFATVHSWISGQRLNPDLEVYARRLAGEYGLGDVLPPESAVEDGGPASEEVVPWERLRNRKVALYTLMEPTGNRLSSLLERLCPGCRVTVNSEKDGSGTLKDLAERADLFVMVTGCAKHAATEFIERHRPAALPLLRPAGRGSSSVLAAIADYLKSLRPPQVQVASRAPAPAKNSGMRRRR